MRTRDPNQNLDRPPIEYAKRSHGHGGLAFMTTLALLLSMLSLLISGFLAYRFLNLQQAFAVVDNALKQQPSPDGQPVDPTAPNQTPAQADPNAPQVSNSPTGVQSNQSIQSAIGNKAQVELISVQRIQNPDTRARDAVNVQFRVRRSAANETIEATDGLINPNDTTASNPTTNEVYSPVDRVKRSSPAISVDQLGAGATGDAYVWLRVPEGVNAINISIPKTQIFRNVPIAN